MVDEKCPYCGQEITKTELKIIEKRIEKETNLKYEKNIGELSDLIRVKDDYIKSLDHDHGLQLEKIISDNTQKINQITNSNSEIIADLRTQRQEDKLHFDRLQNDFEGINDKFRKQQSELIGEIGEIQLLETLSETFISDSFNTQSRGTAEADIVQTIHHDSNPLDIRMCYDNKQKTMVTKAHIDKAKKYQQIHNTKYVFVVSSILPKKDIPNSLFGVKEGIFLVHPAVVIEVVKLIRGNLIEIHTKKNTQENRDSKESELYEFVTGHQFALKLSVISNCYSKLDELLKTEMNSHNRSWKQRRKALDELFRAKIDLEQEINVITDTTIKEIEMPLDSVPDIDR